MKKILLIALVILVLVGGVTLVAGLINKPNPVDGVFGFDSENVANSQTETSLFSSLASPSSKVGSAKTSAGRVYALEVTSDATSLRYFQLFDAVASTSNNPFGASYTRMAPQLVYSLPIPASAASSSPTVVRIDSSMFAPAMKFNKGITWAISSSFATYSSASVTPARHQVKINYK